MSTAPSTERTDPARTTPAPGAARLSDARLPDLPRVLPPWPGEDLPVHGGRVHVRRTPWRGPVEDGPGPAAPRERALYVHGLGGASTNWTDLAALLAVRFDGWALDLPGFGRSGPPARGYSVHRHARAVLDVLEHVRDLPGEGAGRPVHLLGNSLGGLVSLLVAARRPDLVATLTLVSPAMPVYRVPPVFTRALVLLLVPGVPTLAARRMAGTTPEQHVRGMVRMCFGDPSRIPPERLRETVEELRERAGQPWADHALVRSMRGLLTSYLRVGRNGWRLARRLPTPTLVTWGTSDKLVDPAMAPRLAAAMPAARLQLLDGVGHVAQLETPEPVARAVLALAEDHPVG